MINFDVLRTLIRAHNFAQHIEKAPRDRPGSLAAARAAFVGFAAPTDAAAAAAAAAGVAPARDEAHARRDALREVLNKEGDQQTNQKMQ